ncbi:MAG: hypothetical protein QXF28_05035 [Nitrososphaerota archaeon]
MKIERFLGLITLLLLLTALVFFVVYISRSSTFAEISPPRSLVEVELAGPAISSYLWTDRSQDVVVQAFILFSATLGGLLFFKAGGW